jgi:hypothetical protein
VSTAHEYLPPSHARRRWSSWTVRVASLGRRGQGVAELAVLLGVAAIGVAAALILLHGADATHAIGAVSAQ